MNLQQQAVAYQTMVVKEVSRFMRIWIQTLLPPAISMTLYFVIFGNLGEMDGLSYMQYIAPGIIMMSIINNAYSNVVSSFFGAKFQKHIEEMLVSPIPNYLILAGYITGGMARGLLVGFIVSIVALFFTDLHVYSYTLMIAVVLLTSILFSLGGMVNGIFAKKFDDISIIPTFILTPLTYLGGIFYSIDMLPEFWQKASLFNPILYMINAFRYGMLGVSDINVAYAFSIIGVFVIVLSFFCLYLLNRGIGLKS